MIYSYLLIYSSSKITRSQSTALSYTLKKVSLFVFYVFLQFMLQIWWYLVYINLDYVCKYIDTLL